MRIWQIIAFALTMHSTDSQKDSESSSQFFLLGQLLMSIVFASLMISARSLA